MIIDLMGTAERIARRFLTAEWKGWTDEMPVQVVHQDHPTEVFPNLAAAQKKYPRLDPSHNSKEFTWAMRGEIHGHPAIRFESWKAYEEMSR